MNALTPDAHGVAVMALIVTALFLFTRDRIPLESSALAVIIVLAVGFQLFPYEVDGVRVEPSRFLRGFGNEALITICSLIIIGKGLENTGALQPVAKFAGSMWLKRPKLALLSMLISVYVLSAFVNDTPIVVLMLPILIGISLRTKLSASGFLLPMGLATIMGGMCTSIGTSTNLLVVGITRDLGVADIGMFDFTLPAVIVGGMGLLFIWLAVPKLLPDRAAPMSENRARLFDAQLTIHEDGFAAGKTLGEVLKKTDGEMRVQKIQRRGSLFVMKLPSVKLEPGDRLYVRDTAENLKRFEATIGAILRNTLDDELDDEESHYVEETMRPGDQQVAEIVVTRDSPLYLRTLSASRHIRSYGLVALAVHRARATGTSGSVDPGSVRLRAGDVVLVQGGKAALDALKNSGKMLVLDGTMDLPAMHGAKRSLAVLLIVVGVAALGLLPISVTAVVGVGLMVALGSLNWRDVGASIPLPVIMLIVASLAMGKALVATGMADYLAAGFVAAAHDMPKTLILSTFMLIVAVLTNIVSNNAAAVIGTPIAIATAEQLGVDPLPFVFAVLFGANMSFATPFGYQTNLLILSAGGYRFFDFVKVGVPLIGILWAGFSIVLPVLYPL